MIYRYFNPLNWRKSVLVWLLLATLMLWFGWIDTYSIRARIELQNEKKELIHETERLLTETLILQEKMEELDQNSQTLEQIAREEYGMRKPAETIYRIRE